MATSIRGQCQSLLKKSINPKKYTCTPLINRYIFYEFWGWLGGAKMLDKLPVPGWITVGQGPIALAVGAGGGFVDIFSLIYYFYFLSS